MLLRRVVHENVDAAELADRRRDVTFAHAGARDVTGQQKAFHAVLLHADRRLTGVGLFIEVGDGHVRALLGKGQRHRTADAAVPTGDQGHLARHFPQISAVGMFTDR